MPPKKVTVATLPAGQQSIQFLFQKPSAASAGASAKARPAAPTREEPIVRSTDTPTAITGDAENPEVQAFYASLSPAEKIAHAIAVEKLGTSYDVTRTHGFLKWRKSLK